jgi:hypothetical protein
MADLTLETEGLRIKAHENLVDTVPDGTFIITNHTGGAGVADSSVEIQGYRILAHDNGDGSYSFVTTATTGSSDVTVEFQGLRFRLHPTGGSVTIDGVSCPVYAIVTHAV